MSTGIEDESHWPGIGGPFFDKNIEYVPWQPKEPPRSPQGPQVHHKGTQMDLTGSPMDPKVASREPKAAQRHQKEAKGTFYIFTNSRSTAQAAN